MGNVTLQTIADHVGVSRMTVSNAFSRPDQLSAELRDRVLAAATELGYVGPDPRARALKRGNTGAVGVLLTKSLAYAFTDDVAMRFFGAIAEEVTSQGLALTLLSADETGTHVPARDVGMDGALVYSCDPTSPALGWLLKRQLPLVYVDQAEQTDIPSVNVDDYRGAQAAARHLLDLGHRKVGLLYSAPGPEIAIDQAPDPSLLPHAVRQRYLGWKNELDKAGATARTAAVPMGGREQHYEAARQLLSLGERPTAVLCFSDVMAAEAIRAAHDLQLQIPEDLSVVGFDDSPVAMQLRPTLTTVKQDFAEKGRLAAKLMTEALATKAASAPARHYLLPTELIVRESTAPPRAATR